MVDSIDFQTLLNEWDHIDRQIERSKIKRYPYKQYLGESLTSYLFREFDEGKNSSQALSGICDNDSIKRLMDDYGVLEKDSILKNLYICVCARYTEWKRFNR